jgi:GDP-perosamine N-formyltransferase
MQIILCGYNWAGCKALDILLEKGNEVFVYTHNSPYYVNDLKGYCLKKGVPFTVEKISISNLPFKPDVVCSIYYRDIISQDIIDFCEGKIFNLHPSLLPKYKGCSSITWAIIKAEKYIGYSYHYLTNNIDGGDILFQEKIKLEEYDLQSSIYFRVMFLSMKNFYEVLLKVNNKEKGYPQGEGGEYFKRGAPYYGEIDKSWDINQVERFIRAMIFPPLPLATFEKHELDSLDNYLQIKK